MTTVERDENDGIDVEICVERSSIGLVPSGFISTVLRGYSLLLFSVILGNTILFFLGVETVHNRDRKQNDKKK